MKSMLLGTINIIAGLFTGFWASRVFTLNPSGLHKLYLLCYTTGILPFLIVLLEGCFISGKHKWAIGLCLTLPMYAVFFTVWVYGGGSLTATVLLHLLLLTFSGAGFAYGAAVIRFVTRQIVAKAANRRTFC